MIMIVSKMVLLSIDYKQQNKDFGLLDQLRIYYYFIINYYITLSLSSISRS